jgi:signal peptidase I
MGLLENQKNQHSSTRIKHQDSGFTKFRKEWIEPIIIALILVFLIKTFIIQNFKIPSSSMEDTLLIGDRLFAVKFIYGAQIPFTHFRICKVHNPKSGDVVVFKYPRDPSKDFIKRCIAVEGQTVEIHNKQVFVDGKLKEQPKYAKFIDHNVLPSEFGPRDNYPVTVIPKGNLFVMGDNRDNSNDSRFWDFVPYDNLKGKALFVYWSIDPDIPIYDLVHKIRWKRLFMPIK